MSDREGKGNAPPPLNFESSYGLEIQSNQGPWSNFEIGGGAPLVTQFGRGTRHFFLVNLYNFQNIGGGGGATPRPLQMEE